MGVHEYGTFERMLAEYEDFCNRTTEDSERFIHEVGKINTNYGTFKGLLSPEINWRNNTLFGVRFEVIPQQPIPFDLKDEVIPFLIDLSGKISRKYNPMFECSVSYSPNGAEIYLPNNLKITATNRGDSEEFLTDVYNSTGLIKRRFE